MKKWLKNLMLICFTFVCLFSFNINSKAVTINSIDLKDSIMSSIMPMDECTTMFGSVSTEGSPAYWIDWILNLMKYIAIIALLVLITIDFLTALAQNDKDAIKKASGKAMKRFIYCIILFFIPTIVNLLLNLFGLAEQTCDIEGVTMLWKQFLVR